MLHVIGVILHRAATRSKLSSNPSSFLPQPFPPQAAATAGRTLEVAMSEQGAELKAEELQYVQYQADKEETYLPAIRQLISRDLSEPYSIYVYRYFLYQWGDLCYMALDSSNALIGVVVCKLEPHRSGTFRGYIAMLAVQEPHRGKGIATKLVCMAIDAMAARDADEIVLETEVTNTASLKLYERLGFLRSKRLHRYYLNGNTAFRLVLHLKPGTALKRPIAVELGIDQPGQYQGYPSASHDPMGP